MRVLIVNTSERIGGAAIAANRLMNALKKNNVKAKMLVRDKQTDEVSVIALRKSWRKIWNFLWERQVIWINNAFSKQNLFAVDIANTGTDITLLHEFEKADVIHLHWINQGMLSLQTIRKILHSGKPVVWTMHDMWPVTGICHHANTCEKYKTKCHHCPLLQLGGKKDLSQHVFQEKAKCYTGANLTLVGCSRWIAHRAEQSALTKGDKKEARKRCHLPEDKKLLLFGSVKISNKQKGIDYLIEACKLLKENHPDWSKDLGVVVFGQEADRYASLFPFPCYAMNYVSSEQERSNSEHGGEYMIARFDDNYNLSIWFKADDSTDNLAATPDDTISNANLHFGTIGFFYSGKNISNQHEFKMRESSSSTAWDSIVATSVSDSEASWKGYSYTIRLKKD